MNFRVDLAVFRGPMDLLLHLVRKHELDAADLPIAQITTQFLQYLEVLEQIDVNLAGDFLEVASNLIEIKSRLVLPRNAEVEEEVLEDPRQELVQRLLEYKKFKDAANMLEERSRQWQQRFGRMTDDLADVERQPAEESFREVELWDLVSAFGRILRANDMRQPANIVYDDTPIHVHMERIQDRLIQAGRLPLSQLFQPGQHKSALVGIFLAVLELVRHHGAITEQDRLFTEIWILPGSMPSEPLDATQIDNYDHSVSAAADVAQEPTGRPRRSDPPPPEAGEPRPEAGEPARKSRQRRAK
ncbi:MAG TPA: segregation/condensation protein A [Pirellulales bacterium]|jgi:segregation and condensation protein A|nr:segregation/condensation protein A [Pirellulales bacterium]